ncbi:hypothetical protein C4580_06285 [Candidatus Woesearchaeota archaeon]|nr:MAG: hypothetical protein C4580_06285 [Candidatus Woesearchaeota archaeon]
MSTEEELNRYLAVGEQVSDYADRYMTRFGVSAIELAREVGPRIKVDAETTSRYISMLRRGNPRYFVANGNQPDRDAPRLWRLGVLLQVLGTEESEGIVQLLRKEYGPLFAYPPGEMPVEVAPKKKGRPGALERIVRKLMPKDRELVERAGRVITDEEDLLRIAGALMQAYGSKE